jgi:tRNA(Arg) A34 adenosine deaminase TadA
MFIDEFRVAVAHAVALTRTANLDVAILWNGDAIESIHATAKVDPMGTALGLPIVRLLRNRGERLARGYTISTTAPPTEACLGMARMCGVFCIYHLSGTSIKKITCKRSGTTNDFYSTSFKGSIPNVTKLDTRNRRMDVAWYNTPDKYPVSLGNWLAALAGRTDYLGTAATAARNNVIGTTAPLISSFASTGLEYISLKTLIPDQEVLDNVMMMLAFEMVAQVSGYATSDRGVARGVGGQRSGKYRGQNIGSLLVDEEGNIIGWGFNTNKENSTRHGEVNLIVNFFSANPGDLLPNGGTIYTTLEPCEMCSGFIARAVHTGYKFRVIYGQKDDNVTSTALQRIANPAIAMSASKANLASPAMIRSGSGVGASRSLVTAIGKSQKDQNVIETTKFLKMKSTYEAFFGNARPQWWLYMWDYLASKTPLRDNEAKLDTLLKDPEIMRINKELDVVYMLVEMFMQTVRRQGATD